jgi:hypothetical protein
VGFYPRALSTPVNEALTPSPVDTIASTQSPASRT